MPESVRSDRSEEHEIHRGEGEDRKQSRKHRPRREEDDDRRRRKRSKREDDSNSSSEESRRQHRRKKSSRRRKSKSSRRRKSKKKSKRSYSSDESSGSDSSSSSSGEEKKKVVNEKLLAKLSERGETLEERKERRAQKRAAKISSRFGYTAEENPFNDPNLHEAFNWTKKKLLPESKNENADTLEQIDTIRRRRKEREEERDEMDRQRAEESRMKELENYDEWAKKEELFHLEQQRKRSAIRLVEGREKPIDILVKNLLLFGLTHEEKSQRAAVKYQEKYNALDDVEKLDAELEEPHKIVKVLKLVELNELLLDIDAFRILEKEGSQSESKSSILHYWDALYLVAQNEIKFLQNGGEKSDYARKVNGIKEIFGGQSRSSLMKMKDEILIKLGSPKCDDRVYWQSVKEQLVVHVAILDLSEIHKKMLVRQLEKLEQRKEELAKRKEDQEAEQEEGDSMVPKNVDANFGNAEQELDATDEVNVKAKNTYSWQDRYAPRKPRYFNRVKTGYDWNKYNQTHYDSETPPPKIVQGYSFNIFYPDLVDPTKTPQYFVEPADSNEFCILRFRGGAPYEDIAFKIINREWNRSRKRGFKCTFERGILSLYFNFATHWYRR